MKLFLYLWFNCIINVKDQSISIEIFKLLRVIEIGTQYNIFNSFGHPELSAIFDFINNIRLDRELCITFTYKNKVFDTLEL